MKKAIQKAVAERALGRCEYCHLPQAFSRLKFTVDHTRARQHGGGDELENLAFACGPCNRHKGPNIAGIDPLTGQMTRLFHPRLDKWTEHFRWEHATIRGVTPIGRATVAVLDLNSWQQLLIRQVLIDEGVFPLT